MTTQNENPLMEPEDDGWYPFNMLDWDNPEAKFYHIDTRDFCGTVNTQSVIKEKISGLEKIMKQQDKFICSKEEVLAYLNRYFEQSGGEIEWRFFMLEGIENWNLKYLRIAKIEEGFIVCDKEFRALNRDILDGEAKNYD